jgi:uncharacterized protein YndB with AHSA1/START domain
LAEERELVHKIDIDAPITAVWAELTKLDGRQRAMMDTVLESTLEVGAPLYYKSEDGKRVFIVGRIVEIDPPHRLTHTQRLVMRDDPFTLVSWELTQIESGTRVTLRHSGWPADTPKLDKVDTTWASILPELKRVVETGDISPKLKRTYAMMRAFMWAMPPKTKTKNVAPPPA